MLGGGGGVGGRSVYVAGVGGVALLVLLLRFERDEVVGSDAFENPILKFATVPGRGRRWHLNVDERHIH